MQTLPDVAGFEYFDWDCDCGLLPKPIHLDVSNYLAWIQSSPWLQLSANDNSLQLDVRVLVKSVLSIAQISRVSEVVQFCCRDDDDIPYLDVPAHFGASLLTILFVNESLLPVCKKMCLDFKKAVDRDTLKYLNPDAVAKVCAACYSSYYHFSFILV